MGIRILCGKCGKWVCGCALALNLGVATVGDAEPVPEYGVAAIVSASATTSLSTGTTVVTFAIHDQVSGNEFLVHPQQLNISGRASAGLGPTGLAKVTGAQVSDGENGPPPSSRGQF
jgi:hypothetical protein